MIKPKQKFIYVPSTGLYISKQRTHFGLNWYECHKQLHKENLLMPTISQFIAYINYLKQNPRGTHDETRSEIESILNNILTVRDPWRAEWLDAKFEKKGEQFYINYNHKINSNGKLKPENSELLEKCLMENGYADILTPNKQGLPTKKLEKSKGRGYYGYPGEDFVASFSADSFKVGLDCFRDPNGSSPVLGVYACVETI